MTKPFFYDDSSDEDDISTSLAEFDIDLKWGECKSHLLAPGNTQIRKTVFKRAKDCAKTVDSMINDYFKYSFILHAAASQIYYGDDVRKIYYPQKRELLSLPKQENDHLLDDLGSICVLWVKNIFDWMLGALLKKEWCEMDPDDGISLRYFEVEIEGALIDSSFKRFLREKDLQVKQMAQSIFEQCSVEELPYFYYGNEDQKSVIQEKIISCCISLLEDFYIFAIKIKNEQELYYREPADVGETYKKVILDKVFPSLRYQCIEMILAAMKDLGVVKIPDQDDELWERKTKKDFSGKKKIPDNYLYKDTLAAVYARVVGLRGGTKIKPVVKDFVSEKVLEKYLREIVENDSEDKVDNLAWELTEEDESFSQCLRLSDARFKLILSEALPKIFLKIMEQNHLFIRSTIPSGSIFESSNKTQFLALLRLNSRSQKREIKNVEAARFSAFLHKDISGRSMPVKSCTRLWKFGLFPPVDEEQFLLHGGEGRSDFVQPLGNYHTVARAVKRVKEFLKEYYSFGFTDKLIACSVRECLNSEKLSSLPFYVSSAHLKEIYQLVSALTFLMFGCEATRNLSTLISGQMLLDIMGEDIVPGDTKKGAVDWQFLFCDVNGDYKASSAAGIFPMSISGAISAARVLQEYYNEWLPYPYRYEGKKDADAVWDLVLREADTLKRWVSYKKLNLGNLADVYNAILKSAREEWFGVPIKQEKNLEAPKKTSKIIGLKK